jgi:pilus assembly protein CpaF
MAFGTKKLAPRAANDLPGPSAPTAPRAATTAFGGTSGSRPVGGFGQSSKAGTGSVAVVPVSVQGSRAPSPVKNSAIPSVVPEAVVSANYYEYKKQINDQLLSSTEMMQRLGALENAQAAAEIQETARAIMVALEMPLSRPEQDQMLRDLVDDILGFGPLQPLLDRDDIADIMINGPSEVFIEVGGKIEPAPNCRFTDEAHLFNIAQRIVMQRGRKVDEATPMCDTRLNDGSRVNVIVPPLTKHTTITIRKFKRDRLTLNDLVKYGAIHPDGAELLKIIGKCRLNVIVSGGTGSGKTTLLNTLTAFINRDERIVTCEDTAELQLQQPHVVTMETRPPGLEGTGEVSMQDLVRNSLRMRPTRIIIGEVRGEEMFDLLQAMNTGHEGSMGTLHANDPRLALSRMESMVIMGKPNLNVRNVREMIAESVHVIVQVNRLPDGSRRITNISEITGMEGETISMQPLMEYVTTGEDDRGRLVGHHKFSGTIKPKFFEKAAFYGEGERLQKILSSGI